jgi:hypothetical protein
MRGVDDRLELAVGGPELPEKPGATSATSATASPHKKVPTISAMTVISSLAECALIAMISDEGHICSAFVVATVTWCTKVASIRG